MILRTIVCISYLICILAAPPCFIVCCIVNKVVLSTLGLRRLLTQRTSRKLKHFAFAFGKDVEALPTSAHADSKTFRPHQYAGRVQVLDVTRILPISKGLAKDYVM